METETSAPAHLVSVVIPVYQGERTLEGVVDADRRLRRGADDTGRPALPRDRGRARPRLRSRRLRRGDPSARRGPGAGAPGVAEPQLRPACRHARRDRRLGRGVGRHHGRGRPTRPRADRPAHRHRDARTGRRRLRPGHERPRTDSCAMSPRGAKWFVVRLAKETPASDFARPPPARRGGRVGRGLRRAGHLPRRGHLLGRAAGHDVSHADASGTGPPVGHDLRALVSHFWRLVLSSGTARCDGSVRSGPRPCCWRSSLSASSPAARPAAGRCPAGHRR